MKTSIKFFLTASLMTTGIFTTLPAKTLEIKVANVRNDKGNILVMANIPGSDKPLYEMTKAQKGTVTLQLNIEAETADISLFHDENGDYQMAKDEKGIPAEGYTLKKCKLTEEQNTVTLKLIYPSGL